MGTSEISPWLLTGMAETSGSFTFSRTGIVVAPYFAFTFPRGEEALPEAIREFFHGGRRYDVATGIYLRFCRRADLQKIVDHFDRFPLRGVRRHAFSVWRELVSLKTESGRNQPWDRLHELAETLSGLNRGKRD